MKTEQDIKLLCAALMFARNHLEVITPSADKEVRAAVVATLDRVLKDYGDDLGVKDMREFHKRYPRKKT